MLVHVDVHRGTDQDRCLGREGDGREQIVGDAGGELGNDVRRRWRDDDRIGRIGELDVTDL
jgi:hypothetical protein